MDKNYKEIIVKSYYPENGEDIMEILKKSILLFIESEVRKLCGQGS